MFRSMGLVLCGSSPAHCVLASSLYFPRSRAVRQSPCRIGSPAGIAETPHASAPVAWQLLAPIVLRDLVVPGCLWKISPWNPSLSTRISGNPACGYSFQYNADRDCEHSATGTSSGNPGFPAFPAASKARQRPPVRYRSPPPLRR